MLMHRQSVSNNDVAVVGCQVRDHHDLPGLVDLSMEEVAEKVLLFVLISLCVGCLFICLSLKSRSLFGHIKQDKVE